MTIPNIQTIFKEINEGKLLNELKHFLSGGNHDLRIHAIKNDGVLNESNDRFLEYLTSHYCKEILSFNKIKLHLESGNIYCKCK